MLIRALIVLLVALNLGAAAWWLTRPIAPLPVPPAQRQGVARLQLLSESTPVTAPKAVVPDTSVAMPATAVATAEDARVAPRQCFSLGPFADNAAAAAASTRLGSQASQIRPREVPGKSSSGYSVLLPPSADREAAQVLAQRIGAAGFDDYLVVNTGEQLNGIALGRYRSRDAAEKRQSALKAAGFPAQLEAIGNEGASQWWLELAAVVPTTSTQLKQLANAAQIRSLDCAALR